MKYALIENGIVIQTQRSKDNGFSECPENVSAGMLFDGTNYTNPPPPPPPTPKTKKQREDDIDFALEINEPFRLILEACEELNGITVGDTIARAKSKVI